MADIARIVLPSAATSTSAVAATSRLRLMGFSVIESAGSPAAARVSIQEGTSTDLTKEMVAVSLLASESVREWFGDHGIPCPGGIWINRISGETRVTIYYRISDYAKDSGEAPGW